MAQRRFTSPIPNSSANTGPAVIYERPIPLLPDATNLSLTFANTTGTGPQPFGDLVTDIAVYTSNGFGQVALGATPLAKWLAVTIPGNGTPVTMPTTIANPVPGPDGNVVVVYEVGLASDVCLSAQCTWGFYFVGGTVDPPPDPLTLAADPNPVYEIYVDYDTSIGSPLGKYFVEYGDSISIADVATTGFTIAAFNQVATTLGAASCILGCGGVALAQLADPVTYPVLWGDAANAHVDGNTIGIFEDGVNGLGSGAAALIADLTAAVAHFQSLGGVYFFTRTISPQVSYPGTEADRLAYNTFIRNNTLGAVGYYDAAAASNSPLLGLADPGNPAALDPALSADGTHTNDAGQTQEADGWLLVINAFLATITPSSSIFSDTVWPALVYPPFPRVENVEALTIGAPTPSSRIGGTAVPGPFPRLLYPPFPRVANVEGLTAGAPTPSSRNGGTATPAPAPPSVIPPPASSGRVTFTPAATISPNLTVVPATTTQRQINTTFRIVDLRLNNQGN
jgi:hypothetical protein